MDKNFVLFSFPQQLANHVSEALFFPLVVFHSSQRFGLLPRKYDFVFTMLLLCSAMSSLLQRSKGL